MKLENKCIYVSVNQYVTEEDGTKTKIFRCDLDLIVLVLRLIHLIQHFIGNLTKTIMNGIVMTLN